MESLDQIEALIQTITDAPTPDSPFYNTGGRPAKQSPRPEAPIVPSEPKGYVCLPSRIVQDRKLKDPDIRVLLILVQMGWREGKRDGVVRASTAKIGARIGKSSSRVRDSLGRLESLDTPLISRDMDSIEGPYIVRLLFDRYGEANVIAGITQDITIIPATTGVAQIQATPAQPQPEMVGPVSIEGDLAGVAHFRAAPSAAQIQATHHYLERVDHGGGSETPAQIQATPHLGGTNGEVTPTLPSIPKTIPALIGWLPAITDDPAMVARLTKKIPLWVEQLILRKPDVGDEAIGWIQDALIEASEKDDVLRYASRVLKTYLDDGGPKARTLAMPDETDIGRPVDYSDIVPEILAPLPASKRSYGQRVNAERAAIKAKIQAEKARRLKEAEHGDRA